MARYGPGRRLGPALARATLSLSGYLRRRPELAAEAALRAVFSQLDQELAVVLGHPPVIVRPRDRRASDRVAPVSVHQAETTR